MLKGLFRKIDQNSRAGDRAEKLLVDNISGLLNMTGAKNPYGFGADEITKVKEHRAQMKLVAQSYINSIEAEGPTIDRLLGLANVRNDLAEYESAQSSIEQLLDISRDSSQMPQSSVAFMMTDKCNLRCKHCFIFNEELFHPVSRKEELNAGQYVQIFKSLMRTGRNYGIHITGGGEVFARKDFEEIMKQLSLLKVNYHVSFQTNGHFPERLQAMLEDSDILDFVDVIQFSLDGLEKTHNEVRGNGNFAKLVESMEIASRFGIETSTVTTILPDNINSLKEIGQLSKSLGVTNHRFQLFFEGAQISLADISKASEFITERDRSLVFNDKTAPGKGCLAGIRTCVVRPNGVIETCRESYSGNVPRMIIGDVREHDFDLPQTLSSPGAIEAMRQVKECNGCAAFCAR